jgi:hypothetical protein
MRIASLAVAVLVAASAPASAQHLRIDGSRLRPATDTFYTLVVSPGRVDTTGWATQSLSRSSLRGNDVWTQVYRWHDRDGSGSIDSLTMDMSLLPLSERRSTSLGSVTVVYSGSRIHAAIQPASGAQRVLDTAFASTVYASASLDALARALAPANVSTSVDLYYPFPAPLGVRPGSFEIRSSATIVGPGGATVPCWVVASHTGGGVTTFWISKTTGEVVQFDDNEGGTVFRFRRPGAPAA